MNSEAIDLLIEKNPRFAKSREKLEAMQPGAYCMHRSWGFGKIVDYNEAENRLVIDFEDKAGHAMEPAFCVDKLDILPETHILVRQQTEPDFINDLVKSDPCKLIREILKHQDNQAATTAEIENLLRKLIGETTYKRWWTKTKKLLVKDPDVATPSRKIDPYELREEPLTPEQEILEEFYYIKQPLKKILLAEKLHALSDNVDEIRQDLPQILDTLTNAIKSAKGLKQAERLHGMWVRNDLARHLEIERILAEHNNEEPKNMKQLVEEAVDQIEPTSKSLVRETEDLSDLAENLPSHSQKRFLDLITRVYPDEWKPVIISLLRNSSGKFTQECINFMHERGEMDLVTESFQRWLNEQSLRGPVLHWIVKNRNSRKYKKIVEGLVGVRLFSAIFYAIDNEALQNTGNRRIPLADILSDDVDLVPDLLQDATQETARDLAQTLLLNQGFEDLTKKSLLARFIKLFPKIQTLVAREAEEQTEQLFVSRESLDRRRAELDDLIKVKIPENKKAIEAAREHGDLKENSEYKMARQDQETLLARHAQLENDLERARVTDFTEVTNDAVGVGSVVEIEEGSTGNVHRYAILGAWDSDPEKNILSYKTPLGQSILTRKVGETVTTEIDNQKETWTIKAISRWLDEKK